MRKLIEPLLLVAMVLGSILLVLTARAGTGPEADPHGDFLFAGQQDTGTSWPGDPPPAPITEEVQLGPAADLLAELQPLATSVVSFQVLTIT